MTFGEQVIAFNKKLLTGIAVPQGIEVLNPFINEETRKLTALFYRKFYNDNNKRYFIFGINPGRFGAGITGIGFTDPVNLEEYCGINNPFEKKHELSSVFIYNMIEMYGGVHAFFSKYFITAVCPLGFTKEGKNINYYDDKKLQENVYDFILNSIETQLKFGAYTDKAFCVGGGKNLKFFRQINDTHSFFDEIIALPHPRFILQYKRKQKEEYIKAYLKEFQ